MPSNEIESEQETARSTGVVAAPISNLLFGSNILTGARTAMQPGLNHSPILYAILTLNWIDLAEFPETTAQAIAKGWFSQSAFSGLEKDSTKAYKSFISKIVALLKSNIYLSEVFFTKRHTDETDVNGFYPLAPMQNPVILELMGVSSSEITQKQLELYFQVWKYYDNVLHGIFQLTTTGSANVMVQNVCLMDSGWYILQLFEGQFKSMTTGTKIEYFQKIVSTQFANNKSPLTTQTSLTELFSSLSGPENSIGLSEEMKVLFIFNAMGDSYGPLKAQILSSNCDLSEQSTHGLFNKIRTYFDTVVLPNSHSGKGNHTNSFVADKHQKGGRGRGGGRGQSGGRGRGNTNYKKKPLGASGGVTKKLCTQCGRTGHSVETCRVPICSSCKTAGRPFTHRTEKCWHNGATTATVNATQQYYSKPYHGITPTVDHDKLARTMVTVNEYLKQCSEKNGLPEHPAKSKFDRKGGNDSASD